IDHAFPKCDVNTLTLPLLVGIISLGGLAGNAIVLWLLGFCLRKNAFSMYILNLAAANFLSLCFHTIGSLVEPIISRYSIFISIPIFLNLVSIFAYLSGLSFLSTINPKCYLRILCPIWYCCCPRQKSAVMRALLWVLSLLMSFLEGNYCGLLLRDVDCDWCPIFDFITAGWLLFLLVGLARSSQALLARILWKPQQLQLTRLYMVILAGLLLLWPALWHTKISAALASRGFPYQCQPHLICFSVGSFRHQRQQQLTLKLGLQRALEAISEMKKRGRSLRETREVSEVVSCGDSVSTRI
uniref:G-protein coupled receptors family 1 profile domain-containing protein n=1 Tax=Sus scrofa TaxID=9823 RepID=A0A8D1FH76_PIG